METSILVAQILGLVYVVLGLGMLLNGAYYKKTFDELLKSPSFMFFGGIMSLILGFLIVRVHNFWVMDWTVIVTIIGWGALLKGFMIFLAPKALISFSKPILKNVQLIGFFAFVLGLVMGYFGFFA
ncbi:hypothetical protein HN709_04955 [Candidatus Peregrinibacteria bacterium]|jgi:uncharacterized protein YjeT (DUF2065 family)|nr:hypothetical protein [Candidatus Peregrinibacteria bacterium]MBT7737011.1 hypothetical protein [Candidatus Peregrinibacteria bacterium]